MNDLLYNNSNNNNNNIITSKNNCNNNPKQPIGIPHLLLDLVHINYQYTYTNISFVLLC